MPQPVDLQTELARTSAADRIQQYLSRASLVAQQGDTREARETQLAAEQQIHETAEDAESQNIDEDAHRQNPFMGKRRRRGKGDSEGAGSSYGPGEKHNAADGDEGQTFDVTI